VTKILVFVGLSIGIIYLSRASMRAPRSHGFYRFFAWEFTLALLVLNIDYWIINPFIWYQIISWFLLIFSLIPLVFGVSALLSKGKPAKHRKDDAQLLAFEKTTTLVTTGIYHWIRHPLYSSLLFLTWGTYFKVLSLTGFLLAVAASLFLVATAKADEEECIRFFGSAYQEYMHQTKRFVPFLF
jgi:protein-S-isoprenylcysteine O-methyltransferase Ste14